MDNQRIDYNEKWFLLILLIVVSTLYSAIGYLTGNSDGISTHSFAINFFYSSLVLLILKFYIDFLDKKIPWNEGLNRRFIFQLISTLLIYSVIQSYILFVLEPNSQNKPKNQELIIGSYILGIIFILFANSIYLLLYLNQKNNGITGQNIVKSEANMTFITGSHQGKKVSIPISNFSHILIVNSITTAVTLDGKKVLLQETLTELDSLFSQNDFFRANRQHILSKEIIEDIQYQPNRTTIVKLNNGESLVISRYKTPKFKKWIS